MEGTSFPPPGLNLDELRLEASDVLVVLGEHSPIERNVAPGKVQLSLFSHNGRLAWRALQDKEGAGMRTLFLDAKDGQVLFEKFDPAAPIG